MAEISLVAKDGTFPITPEGGEISKTFVVIRTLVWANFRGLESGVLTTDRRPTIEVRTNETKFDTRFMLVRTDQDNDDRVRSVRMKSGLYSVSSAFVPDEDWVLDTELEEPQPGVWRMTPEDNLDRGEYGVMDTQNRYLYGFGVGR